MLVYINGDGKVDMNNDIAVRMLIGTYLCERQSSFNRMHP